MILTFKSIKDYQRLIEPYVDEVSTDVLGNVIAYNHGSGKRIMFIAHIDVVCLMVSHIDDNGFLYVKPSGGLDATLLPARKVVIRHQDKDVIGIIGKKPIHLIRDESNIVKLDYEDLWIDIGAKNRDEASDMVSVGDYAFFSSDYNELPNELIAGAYFDDMVGVNVLLKLAEQLYDNKPLWDVYFVASNYEEIGMRGAAVAAHAIHPDVCICIDVTHATDYPSMNIIRFGDIKLGEGCVIAKGPNIYPELFEALKTTAVKNEIAHQIEVSPYPTGTDANVIQLINDGIRTAVVSIPCRYMHTPYEICSKRDIDSTVKIIGEFLKFYCSL